MFVVSENRCLRTRDLLKACPIELGSIAMTAEMLAAILARQMSDAEKRRRADFVVFSNLGRGVTLRRLKEIVRLLSKQKGNKWPPPPYIPVRS